jgi:hypothetical protein
MREQIKRKIPIFHFGFFFTVYREQKFKKRDGKRKMRENKLKGKTEN